MFSANAPENRLGEVLGKYRAVYQCQPDKLREAIPAEEVWRFFIDGVHQADNGWVPYERREPGYLKAMVEAFQSIFKNDMSFDAGIVKYLHGLATSGVKQTLYDSTDADLRGEFRSTATAGFPLNPSNASRDGFREFFRKKNYSLMIKVANTRAAIVINPEDIALMDRYSESSIRTMIGHVFYGSASDEEKEKIIKLYLTIKENNDNYKKMADAFYQFMNSLPDWIDKNDKVLTLVFSSTQKVSDVKSNLTEKVNGLMVSFEEKINGVEKPIDKLNLIVGLVQDLEQLHPFRDANCRTFCMLILNELLIKNGFPPAILEDPNQFDLFSRSELVSKVIDGMQNTLDLIEKNKLFNIQTSDIQIPDDLKQYMNEVIHIEKESRLPAMEP